MRKNLKLQTKVSLAFFIAVIACMIILNLFSGFMLKPILVYNSRSNMVTYEKKISEVYRKNPKKVRSKMRNLRDNYVIRTTILSGKGDVYKTNEVRRLVRDNGIVLQMMVDLVTRYEEQGEGAYFEEVYNGAEDLKRIYYVNKIEDDTYIVLSKNIRGIEQDSQIISVYLWVAAGMISILGVIVWSVLTRPFTGTLEKMSRITQNMAHLNFDEKINYNKKDELGILAESIDELSTELEESITHIRQELEFQKELMRNLAHEIKTPLTTICGYTENIQVVVRENERVEEYCQIVLEECDSLNFLAKEMMEVSSLDNSEEFYEKEWIETDTLLEQIEIRTQREMPECMMKVENQNCRIWGNLYLLERAAINYIGNAMKYRIPETEIVITGEIKDKTYIFSVINEGEPIPEKERERIWESFYKVDKSRKRSNSYGIGLAIVRQIAEIHHARTGVRCEDGKNTFYLEIPLQKK